VDSDPCPRTFAISAKDLMLVGEDQDAFSYFIDAYGSKVNIFVDYGRVVRLLTEYVDLVQAQFCIKSSALFKH
jgi:phosphosulfolactate synthase (CoM biosynthesis protein A)